MNGRIYDGKAIRITDIPEEQYEKCIKPYANLET